MRSAQFTPLQASDRVYPAVLLVWDGDAAIGGDLTKHFIIRFFDIFRMSYLRLKMTYVQKESQTNQPSIQKTKYKSGI